MESVNNVMLRGICSLYNENHVAPVLRSMQEQLDALKEQLLEARAAFEAKADAADVPTAAPMQERLKSASADDSGVPTRAQLQNLEFALSKKAEASEVASVEQVHRLVAAAEQKASSREAALCAQVADLAASVAAGGGPGADIAAGIVAGGAAGGAGRSGEVVTGQRVRAICQELLDERAALAPQGDQPAEFKRVQVVIAAAAARFDKQLREVKGQMQKLTAQFREEDALTERWPGRVLGPRTAAQDSETASAAGPTSEAGSALAPSLCGSASGLGPEERMELKRIQAVVGAAGTAFNRELRDLRGGVREVRAEVQALKAKFARG